MLDIENKVIIVTGGSRGLGKAMVFELAKSGAKIVIASRDRKNAEKTIKEVSKITKECLYVKTDISKPEETDNLASETVERFSKIDILINNAAIFIGGEFEDIKLSEWKKIFDINLNGVFYCSRSVSNHMIEKSIKGRIINISSIIGLAGKTGCCAYATSKSAVNMLTKSMAIDLAKYGILVNALAPGVCDSEINSHITEQDRKKSESNIPLKRWAKPEEIAKSVLYLCSGLSTYVNGEILTVDGGYLTGKETSKDISIL